MKEESQLPVRKFRESSAAFKTERISEENKSRRKELRDKKHSQDASWIREKLGFLE